MAEAALEYALDTFDDAEVTVLHVQHLTGSATPWGSFLEGGDLDGLRDDLREETELVFDRARDIAASRDRHMDLVAEVGEPAREIVAYAVDEDVDHVVLGSHGRDGLSRLILGSVSERVVRRSPVPVTVVR